MTSLKVTPLGGAGETGAINCTVYETENEAIVVDCGSMFPDAETLGVDLIIPDFSYLRTIRHKLKGLVLTHGHEDHIGGTPYFLQEFNLPVYGAPFTLGLIREKCGEVPPPQPPQLHTFHPGEKFSVGSFNIDTVFVNHSIPDASALAIQTEAGTLVHLTDWKIDKYSVEGRMTDLKKFSAIGKKGVLALLSDSTNAGQQGSTLSERDVLGQIKKICAKHQGRIVLVLFSSNIYRIQGLANIAKNIGRTLALVGRSMHENTELARQLGYLNLDGVNVVDVEQTHQLKAEKIMVLATGSQGEPRSVLSRVAFDEFKPFKIQQGDLIMFSSRIIPGNEKNVYNVINHLCRRGAKVLYESVHEIHTSGHAHQNELKEAFKRIKPKYFIPIHGDYNHMIQHARLTYEWGLKKNNALVIENGHTIVFEKNQARLDGVVPTGRVFVDGEERGGMSHPILRDRKQLSSTGIVICVLMIDRNEGHILRGPELICRGFVSEEDNKNLMDRAKQAVLDTLGTINFEERTDMVRVQEEVRLSLRRFFRRELDKKPVVIPVIQEV